MTSTDWIPLILSLISAGTAIFVVVRQTRKDRNDIANAISDSWSKLVQPLEARVSALERENKRLRRENLALWSYIEDLRGLLRKNNIEAPELPELEEK